MPLSQTISRIDRIARILALVIGVMIGIVLPGIMIYESYDDHLSIVEDRATLTANIMAEHIYISGRLWQFAENQIKWRIEPIIESHKDLRLTVYDLDNKPVMSFGTVQSGPTSHLKVPILVQEELLGFIEIEFNVAPLLWRLAELVVLGLALGLGTFLFMHFLPLRALRQALANLNRTHAQLNDQIEQTKNAMEMVHRESVKAALANRTKSEFLANMSHELRTPLNSIIGFSEIMKSAIMGPLDERYREYANDILNSGSHLLQLINEVLDISKIEAGKLTVNVEMVDLMDVLSSCERLIKPRAQDGGLTLTVPKLIRRSLVITADPLRLKQVVLNLLSNAVKFTPSGGTVKVDLSNDQDNMVSIRVSDTGCGMTAEQINVAFQPFRQVDNLHSRKHDGTGLGLPLAKQLTELQGGSLTVTSEPDVGTTVTVRFPMADMPQKLSA